MKSTRFGLSNTVLVGANNCHFDIYESRAVQKACARKTNRIKSAAATGDSAASAGAPRTPNEDN